MEPLTAIVLAGGKSSRMGEDKALLPIQGQPLIGHLCNRLEPQVTQLLVVTPWPDRYRSIVPSRVVWVIEPQDEQGQPQGPLVGLAHALATVQTPWTLAIACDLPNLDPRAIARWRQALASLPSSTLAYLPRSQDWWEPLCGFYRRDSLASLNAFIATGGRSFQRWLSTIPVAPIANVDPQLLFNLNTPADWQQFSRHNQQRDN